jgi:hypothetical protein
VVVAVVKRSNFSTRYKTFEEFLKKFSGSEAYKQRIIRLHSKYPNASLSQLRGHPKAREKTVSQLKEKPVYKRSWSELTRKELILREKSLDVLWKVRNGQSLSSASKELHIKPETVIKHTNAFIKSKRKWTAKSQDRISRVMSIYENSKQEWIEIRDSRTASKIGKYNSAVNQFLITGNEDVLKQFKKPFKDVNGKLHYFETNPDKLYEIVESREELEFYEIYKI